MSASTSTSTTELTFEQRCEELHKYCAGREVSLPKALFKAITDSLENQLKTQTYIDPPMFIKNLSTIFPFHGRVISILRLGITTNFNTSPQTIEEKKKATLAELCNYTSDSGYTARITRIFNEILKYVLIDHTVSKAEIQALFQLSHINFNYEIQPAPMSHIFRSIGKFFQLTE